MTMMRRLVAAAVLMVAVASDAVAQTRVETNVIYGMYSGLALLMDVYHPANSNGIGIVFVAGSGFYAPLEMNAAPLKDAPFNARFGKGLTDRGFTMFAVNHRATPRFQYPDPVQDVQRAVRFIRANAKTYGIQPDRIGAAGTSSGAHLASMAGVLDGKGDPEDGDPINRLSAKVQAVVTLFAPFDLASTREHSDAHGVTELFVGARISPRLPPTAPEFKRLAAASPMSYVTRDDPPFLMMHGDADTTVPIGQSVQMEKALKSAGVEAKFITVPGGQHGLNFGFKDGDPRLPDYVGEAARWFERHLVKR
jgi:alpha-L-fucosidase 2